MGGLMDFGGGVMLDGGEIRVGGELRVILLAGVLGEKILMTYWRFKVFI